MKMSYDHLYDAARIDFSCLQGKTLVNVQGLEQGSDKVTFICTDGAEFVMYHSQDCCECVDIDDVCGDVEDLKNAEILVAAERTSLENPEGVKKEDQDSFTWTFYILSTNKGSVTIRWYGESNGYYSESVDFVRTK
jgi:hypothetical protein